MFDSAAALTMVRLGWINMDLHGTENPAIERRDALIKAVLATESGRHDHFLNDMMKGRR
jgi:hypothetical protein